MGFKKKQDKYVDEHSTPTEPLPDISATLFQPPTQSEMLVDRTIPVVLPPVANPPQSATVYPFVLSPALPGTPYSPIPTVRVQGEKAIKGKRRRKRSVVPVLVMLFFTAVQFLLLVRFVILFLSLPTTTDWVGGVLFASELFVWPFQLLWSQIPNINEISVASIEFSTLVAILTYGVLSRLLVPLLKFILNRRR